MIEPAVPAPLAAFLRAFGLVPVSRDPESPDPAPEPPYAAWRPSFPGEEPPF